MLLLDLVVVQTVQQDIEMEEQQVHNLDVREASQQANTWQQLGEQAIQVVLVVNIKLLTQ